jgi:hypothetical protein
MDYLPFQRTKLCTSVLLNQAHFASHSVCQSLRQKIFHKRHSLFRKACGDERVKLESAFTEIEFGGIDGVRLGKGY